jgi:ABC-2 type transport system permease protein
MSPYLQETTAMTRRWFQRFRREPMSIIFGLTQPVLWLALFGNSGITFRNASAIPGEPSYIAFMTGGVVVMTVLNSGLAGGIEMLFDKENGFLERLMAAPIKRSSLIISRFLFVTALTGLQALMILGMAFLFGVVPATGWLGVALILVIGMMLGIGFTAISLGLAFSMKGHGGFFALLGFITLPLIFMSSALVPLESMPTWLAVVAQLNPMTYAINAVRDLILTGWPIQIVKVLVILAAFDAACLAWSNRILLRGMR